MSTVRKRRSDFEDMKSSVKDSKKKYVRPDEGAILYSMGRKTFLELANDAGAIRRIKRIVLILREIYPFKDHPFRVVNDDKMKELTESIESNGVLTPVLLRPDEDFVNNDMLIVYAEAKEAIDYMKDSDRLFEVEVLCDEFNGCMEVSNFTIISEVNLIRSVNPKNTFFEITAFYIKNLAHYIMGDMNMEALDHIFVEMLDNHADYAINFYEKNSDKMHYMDYLLDEGFYTKVVECKRQHELLKAKQAFLIDAITNIQSAWDDIGILYDDEYEFINEDDLYAISIGSLAGSECSEDLKVVLKGCLLSVNEKIYAIKSG
ncbi:MAG: DUF6462 family protein [Lachnospiraceae bacterium]